MLLKNCITVLGSQEHADFELFPVDIGFQSESCHQCPSDLCSVYGSFFFCDQGLKDDTLFTGILVTWIRSFDI